MTSLSPPLLLAITAMGSGMLILLSVIIAYRLGKDRGMRIRSDRFDRLFVEVDFHGTQWTVWEADGIHSHRVLGSLMLRQSGVRLIGEGTDANQCRWTAEGVVFRRGAHLLFVERRERGNAVGSIHLHLDESGQTMTGMMSVWEGGGGAGLIKTTTWKRCPVGVALSHSKDVAISPQGAATEAIWQHATPVS